MKQQQKKQPKGARIAPARKKVPIGIVFLVVVTVIGAGVWLTRSKPVAASNGALTSGASSTPGPTTPVAPATDSGFAKLVGGWRRPDGGYVLLIKSVDANGKVEAAYLNPRSINVARAEASREGSTNKIFIELRDVNYPGSTYKLTYDPDSDQLYGIYNQAALNQQFDVVFARIK